jgi:hypothetical protein
MKSGYCKFKKIERAEIELGSMSWVLEREKAKF